MNMKKSPTRTTEKKAKVQTRYALNLVTKARLHIVHNKTNFHVKGLH